MTKLDAARRHDLTLRVNGRSQTVKVESRTTLADCLRHDLGLTGTHLGCEHGVCGACTVLVDGAAARSCLMLAAQAQRHHIETVESLAVDGQLNELQQAFRELHGLQCGFCTPGMVMSSAALLANNPKPSEAEVRHGLEGNICRCTGYHNIVKAVMAASGQDVAAVAAE